MKANAPEKIWVHELSAKELNVPLKEYHVEYVRTEAFIEKALKWYCLDCECNDNCKDTKCFFYREYERYLKGEKNAIAPKFSDRIINEDGLISDNWRYRHFIAKMQDAFIDKACEYWYKYNRDVVNKQCCGFTVKVEDFRKYMKGE